MAERVVAVRLTAQVAEYKRAMDEAAKATRETGTAAEKLAQQKEAFNQLGGVLAVTGTALTAVTALSVKAAMSWESAWAGVTKTVEGTPEQLGAVEQGLRDLTSVLPASHEEIAAVAEAAGQLGIETDNVVTFTKTMIDLGETTNLSANDAATALARFVNIMGTSQDEVGNLGAALVGLGNNYATTESEILDMAMRLAGAGQQIGLSEGDVLGLATALSSVGIEAEAGGSAMSKVMIDIAASVEEGGARLDMFAKAAGVSAQDFAERWKKDPADALSLFVKGLANAESQGTSTLGILSELGITEVRMRDALLRSASAADMFSGAMARGNEEFEANNALTDEAAKRYETVESKIAIAGNAIRDAAIDMGEVFLPAVSAVAGGVTAMAQTFGDLPDPVQGIIGILGGVVGVAALVGGTFLLAVPKVYEFRTAMQAMGITAASTKANLSSAAGFLGGPWGIAIGAAVAAATVWISTNERMSSAAAEFRDTLDDSSGAVTQYTRQLVAKKLEEAGAFDAVRDAGVTQKELTDAIYAGGKAYDDMLAKLRAAHDASGGFNATLGNGINTVRELGVQIADAKSGFENIEAATGTAAATTKTAADAYQDAAQEAKDLSSEILRLIDSINTANGVGQDAVSTNARYQSAIAGISEEVKRQREEYERTNGTLEGFNLTLDENTAQGSANASQLADVARAAQDAAAAQFEQDKSTMSATDAANAYNDTLAAQRQAFIDSAVEAGYNADQVQALADKVFALPSEKEIAIIAATAAAQDGIDRLISLNSGRTIPLRVSATGIESITLPNGMVASSNADGGMYSHAFASGGGVDTGIYAGRPGSLYKFAEPETVWEAFISGKPDKRERNVAIWQETGRRLGVGDSAGNVTNVSNTYNVPQGPTADQLLRAAREDAAWSARGAR